MKKIIAALIFSLVCLQAIAASADWLVISETRFLYLPSIKRTGDIVSVWVKIINKNNMKLSPNQNVAYTLMYHQYDCRNKKVKVDKIITYNSKDKELSKGRPRLSWQTIKTNTTFETEGGILCKYKITKKKK